LHAGLQFGWYWGKLYAGDVAATWSSMMKTRVGSDPLLVLNIGEEEYFNVEPECIQFVVRDICVRNGRILPQEFVLIVDTDDVSVYVTMTVLSTHHTRIGPIRYWRYHVKCLGSIVIGSKYVDVNNVQIAEFVRFR